MNEIIIDDNLHSIIFFGRLNNPASSKFNEWVKTSIEKGFQRKILDIKYAPSDNFGHSILVIYKDISNGDIENTGT